MMMTMMISILMEATLMIVKHPCMMVGQSVVPTLIHSGCDPGMLLLVSEKMKNYDYADDCELFTMILTCCTIVHNDCDLLYQCSRWLGPAVPLFIGILTCCTTVHNEWDLLYHGCSRVHGLAPCPGFPLAAKLVHMLCMGIIISWYRGIIKTIAWNDGIMVSC